MSACSEEPVTADEAAPKSARPAMPSFMSMTGTGLVRVALAVCGIVNLALAVAAIVAWSIGIAFATIELAPTCALAGLVMLLTAAIADLQTVPRAV